MPTWRCGAPPPQGLLTETLCSVRASEDKFVFSVVWEVDEAMEVHDVRFHRSIVHSRAALSYGEAQAMLDDPGLDTEVARGVRILNKLARVLRRKRMEAGALTLASPEVRARQRVPGPRFGDGHGEPRFFNSSPSLRATWRVAAVA